MVEARTAPSGARARRSRELALRAAGGLLSEGGYGAVTIEAVALRSGVARTTLYRHWPTRQALVADAIKADAAEPVQPDTGSVDEDVRLILTGLAAGLNQSPWARYLPSVLDAAETDAELADAHRHGLKRRQAPLRAALARGVERGELPPSCDVDLLVSLLAGPLIFRRVVTHEPIDAVLVTTLTKTVLSGARA